jgi:GH24 family phage-related lysozyme (muramidase)
MAISNAASKVRPQSKDDTSSRINMPMGIYLAIVKDNADDKGMGRLRVWIPEFKSDPSDSLSWTSVSYASPFAGASDPHATGSNPKSSTETQRAYGMWFVPPDVNNEVLVCFPNGDVTKGVWFACLYQDSNTYTVPGIPFGKTYGETQNAESYPSAEKNKRDLDNDSSLRPRHPTLADALDDQGLTKDFLRGNSTSGAQRDEVSKVYGILTPGQHQFVMDDDSKNAYIRLRTQNGAQIFINDTFGMIYLINRDGTAWFELSADGHIDAYAEGGINMHSLGDINFRAGKDINLEAAGKIQMNSGSDLKVSVAGNGNLIVGGDLRLGAMGSAHLGAGGNLVMAGAQLHLNGPAPDSPETPDENGLAVNTSVRSSIASRVPEHEPWRGHVNLPNPGLSSKTRSEQQTAADGGPGLPADPNASSTPLDTAGIEPNANVDTKNAVDITGLHLSKPGADFILGMERYRPIEYWDFRAHSIGFGHLQDGKKYDKPGDFENGMTYDSAYNKFLVDVQQFENAVKRAFQGCKLTQNAFDALISCAYNMGAGGMGSLSYKNKNIKDYGKAGDWENVANCISSCPHENARRLKEAQVMKSGNYPQGLTRAQLEKEGYKAAKGQIENSKAQVKGPELSPGRYKPIFGAPTEVQKRQWAGVKGNAVT